MDEENLENIDPDEPKNKSKNKRKVLRKVKRKKSKKVCDGEQKDNEELQNFQSCSISSSKRKSLSLEVEKMSQGKTLTHFQAMAMLRKALVASFVCPRNANKGTKVEMKSTENRRLSGEDEENVRKVNLTNNKEADRETVPVEEVKCLVLKGIEEEEEEEKVEVSNQKEDEATAAVKLVNKVAGRTSKWKVVEKEFVQGKDVSKQDAWKLILLSDLFPKGTTAFEDITVPDEEESSSEEEEENDITEEDEEEVTVD